jgi:hypothetical protein
MAFSIAMGAGALLGYLSYLFLLRYTIGFYPLRKVDVEFTGVSLIFLAGYYYNLPTIVLASAYLLVTYYYYVKNYK